MGDPAARPKAEECFVRVSPRDARYFELSDGTPYVPIGLNMIAPPGGGIDGMAAWMERLARDRASPPATPGPPRNAAEGAAGSRRSRRTVPTERRSSNGGNFIRVWLGSPFFDVEHARSGVYDEERAERIDALLALARKHRIRVKLCIESFRHFGTREQRWSAKPLHLEEHGGPARDIADFFDGEKGREQFRRKLAWYAGRYGDDPIIFGWELWNEMDTVAGGDYMAWTEAMLAELHRLFPRNLCMQSLGSFDSRGKVDMYRRMSLMPGNDVAQVHRYLDLGAGLEVCKGPADVLAADAVREIISYGPGRPVLLAESGAVEPRHTGPFKLYQKDEAGIILHDVLFAPFFAGAAGPGHIWHWDRYVNSMDLWHHFGRFAEAIEGIDPPAEAFEPFELPDDMRDERLRVLGLAGRRNALVWCRDKRNTWASELRDEEPPERVRGATLDLAGRVRELEGARVRVYDPWTGEWSEAGTRGGSVALPDFSRSVVVRVERPPGG